MREISDCTGFPTALADSYSDAVDLHAPDGTGSVFSGIEFNDLRRCPVLGMGEQQQLDSAGVAAENGKLHPPIDRHGPQGKRFARLYRLRGAHIRSTSYPMLRSR
jgi:hypothetical protein